MHWILYALSGSFFQAIEMAVKKKALQVKGMNNFIAFLAFGMAGILLLIFFLATFHGKIVIGNFSNFANGIFGTVVLNVLAYYFLYKALDITDLSYLMPFFSFVSLSVIIPPIFLFGEIPSWQALAGILLVVAGAVLIDYRKKADSGDKINLEQARKNKKAKLYFLVVAICWTFSTPMTKLAVLEGSPILVSSIVNIFISVSFILLIYFFKERLAIKEIFKNFQKNEKRNFLLAVFLAGLAIAVSIGSINIALRYAQVAYVIAVKRIMPVFAFFIGYFYFKERENLAKKIIATLLMVAGAVIIGFAGK